MRITVLKVLPVKGNKRLRAYAIIKLDDCFIINNLKVIEGYKGYFVAMPSKRLKNGAYVDIAHPLDKLTRTIVENKIMSEYRRQTGE